MPEPPRGRGVLGRWVVPAQGTRAIWGQALMFAAGTKEELVHVSTTENEGDESTKDGSSDSILSPRASRPAHRCVW